MASVLYLLLALVVAASAAPESRVVGGNPVTVEEFPYIVSFLYYYPGPGITVQRCVGSLLSSWHVLTSGFCFTGAVLDNMQIRAGSTSSQTGGTLVSIAKFEKNPDYEEVPRHDDIAVVFLARALGITDSINALFLPPASTYIPDGTSVKIVSWGFETMSGPQLELLKTVYLNKLSITDCEAKFAGNENVVISDTVICAQAAGKAMCRGDSGAPMVINNVAVGASSYFESCDDEYPAVFSRVDRYTNWILSVTAAGRTAVPTSGERIMAAPVVASV